MFCPKCGATVAADAQFCTNCGTSLNPEAGAATMTTPPPVMPVAAVAAEPQYAGFWRRLLAIFIDSLILSVPSGILAMMFIMPTLSAIISKSVSEGDTDAIVSLVMSSVFGWMWVGMMIWVMKVLYFTFFESSKFQATPGKMVLGIIVTDLQSKPVSFARALGRNLGKILSKLILYIGFIMAGLTAKKQALHDMLADCLVVMK
jgi:uncharacterized RDD family membrane protein YckC